MIKNTQGSYMTFETKQAFNIKIKDGANQNRAINFIFDNAAKDGTVRYYNDRHYTTNGTYSPDEDNVKVGIALHRTEYPEERLDVRGGVKIGEALNQSPANGGHIQFIDGDFEGFDGTAWKSLTQGGIAGGTETIDEGNGPGIAIRGRNPANYGNVGLNAVDLSYSGYPSTTKGATGDHSTAMGKHTKASSYAETSIGSFNTDYTPNSVDTWDAADRIFVVGNGAEANTKSDAMVILKNGNTTINGTLTATAFVGDGFGLTNLPSSGGTESITEGGNTGIAITDRDPAKYGDIGENAVDLSYSLNNSTTKGATGDKSTAMGYETKASGYASTAMGQWTKASGNYSTAMGRNTYATGHYSTAIGQDTDAIGDYSMVMGYETKALSYMETVIGQFSTNYSASNTQSWYSFDRLFVIGNGTGGFGRSDAMVILKNGNTGIGNSTPEVKLQVDGGSDAALNGGGYFMTNTFGSTNIVIDDNEIMARNNGSAATLNLNYNGGVIMYGPGGLAQNSDASLKKNIESIDHGLLSLLKLEPKQYQWKDTEDNDISYGLIAQDVQQIIPELVKYNSEGGKLGLKYVELIPITIKAIKEQQKIIDAQKLAIENQNETMKGQEDRIKALEEKFIKFINQ